jgi:hypothetical protein
MLNLTCEGVVDSQKAHKLALMWLKVDAIRAMIALGGRKN